MMKQPYTTSFFEATQKGSALSAEVIAPIVMSMFRVSSVVDVGCGTGGWLRAFEGFGVADYLGIDGNYVPREMLQIPSGTFVARDLRTLSDVGRRFDLACSLEVAEHLPMDCAEQFVFMLVKAAPVVLFSAAVPGQGGTDHLNEQWQSYWFRLFSKHGYLTVDCIRPVIHGDSRVEPWYRQNTLIFCEDRMIPVGYSPVADQYQLDRVDPDMFHLKMKWIRDWYEDRLTQS